MINSNRNRGRHSGGLCPGGRKCCGDPIAKSKKLARRTVRRIEKQEWKRDV